MTRSLYGVPYGATPEHPYGTDMQIDALSFAANQAELVYQSPTGDDGSARQFYGWQTVFVDNSKNDYPLTLIFTGTLSSKTIPSRSQGYVPAACPRGQFSFRAQCANPNAIVIPIELWAKDIGPSVWGIDQGLIRGAIDVRGQVSVGTGAPTIVIANSTVRAANYLAVKNIGATNLYLGFTASLSLSTGYLLKAGEMERFNSKPFPDQYLRAVSDAAGGVISFIGY